MAREVHDMFLSIAKRYDCANDVLSLGLHRLWRQMAIKHAGISGNQTVVDLCCGTGDFALAALKAVGPSGRVIGVDFVHQMLKLSLQKSKKINRLTFVQGDALAVPLLKHCADVVTVGFGIRNVSDPSKCLDEISRILRPGGTLCILEFGQPKLIGFSQLYRFYSRFFIPFLGLILTGHKTAYRYLPETSSRFPADHRFIELLRSAGFDNAQARPLMSGVTYIYTASSPTAKACRSWA